MKPRTLVLALALVFLVATPLAAAAPPRSPTGLACSPQADGVHLSWTAVAGATGYNVYRKTGPSGTYMVVGVSTNTTFVDHTAAPGVQYVYAVSTVATGGESAKSAPCTVTSIPFFPTPLVAVLALAGAVGLALVIRRR